jgi:hypothetical protein
MSIEFDIRQWERLPAAITREYFPGLLAAGSRSYDACRVLMKARRGNSAHALT